MTHLSKERVKMRKVIITSVLVLSSVLLAACGGAATPTDATSAKPVNIAVTTNPNPATTGDLELILTITDAHGDPMDGAKVDVSADHTDMTGMSMSGLTTEQGGGTYAINANFSMSGNWKLTVYVRKDGHEYKEEIDFKVQ
jgi:predicted component of type VI protein secretion system